MDIQIKGIIALIILFLLISVISDVNSVSKVKNSIFNSVRSANQNSLKELNGIKCDDVMMLETWLKNFIYSYDLLIEEIEIEFLLIQDDPKVYIVKISGYESYCFINEETYFSYISCGTIVND